MSFDTAAQAQLAEGEVGAHWLVELDLLAGTLYLTTFNLTVTIGGHEYIGLGGNLTIEPVRENEKISNDKVSISLPISNQALVTAVLASVEAYRGRPARLFLQLFNAQHQPVGAPVRRLTAKMEPVSIQRENDRNGSTGGKIEMRLVRAGLDRSRRYEGRRLSDSQQRSEFAGDTGLRYMRQLIEQPTLWLSKKFQEQ
jgi:hypothetical protein